jgi:hypothetical protein
MDGLWTGAYNQSQILASLNCRYLPRAAARAEADSPRFGIGCGSHSWCSSLSSSQPSNWPPIESPRRGEEVETRASYPNDRRWLSCCAHRSALVRLVSTESGLPSRARPGCIRLCNGILRYSQHHQPLSSRHIQTAVRFGYWGGEHLASIVGICKYRGYPVSLFIMAEKLRAS